MLLDVRVILLDTARFTCINTRLGFNLLFAGEYLLDWGILIGNYCLIGNFLLDWATFKGITGLDTRILNDTANFTTIRSFSCDTMCFTWATMKGTLG